MKVSIKINIIYRIIGAILITGLFLPSVSLAVPTPLTSTLATQSAFKLIVSITEADGKYLISEDTETIQKIQEGYRRDAEILYFNHLRKEAKKIGLSTRGLKRLIGEHFQEKEYFLDAKIARNIIKLKQQGVDVILAGTNLADLSPENIIKYLEAFCFIKDKAVIQKILDKRIKGELVELFDAVFNPRKGLRERVRKTGKPIKIVHVRGGRGAAGITEEWRDLAKQGLVEITIIPGAVDDGRSWADMAFYLGATGIPDIGKSHTNLGLDEKAVDFAGRRLVGDGNKRYSKEQGHELLREALIGFRDDNYQAHKDEVKDLISSFRQLNPEKKKNALKYIEAFMKRIDRERERKQHIIDIQKLALRSILIIGARENSKSWQEAADLFGEFVDSAGKVILPTEERLHAMAILEDGTILPTENAINEVSKNAEYYYFTVGPRSFVDKVVLQVLFLALAGRVPTDEEKEKIERLRVEGYDNLKEISINLLKGETEDAKRKAAEFIEKNLSYLSTSPKIRIQEEAIRAIKECDIMDFGPTDIESNMASALIYPSIAQATMENQKAIKMLISNAVDLHKIEPTGTTTVSQIERLYRYLSGQQRYKTKDLDLERTPPRSFVEYAIGMDEKYVTPEVEDNIPFNKERIKEFGVYPIGLDLGMTTLDTEHVSPGQKERYLPMEKGRYNPALSVDVNLSLSLMSESGYSPESIIEEFSRETEERETEKEITETIVEPQKPREIVDKVLGYFELNFEDWDGKRYPFGDEIEVMLNILSSPKNEFDISQFYHIVMPIIGEKDKYRRGLSLDLNNRSGEFILEFSRDYLPPDHCLWEKIPEIRECIRKISKELKILLIDNVIEEPELHEFKIKEILEQTFAEAAELTGLEEIEGTYPDYDMMDSRYKNSISSISWADIKTFSDFRNTAMRLFNAELFNPYPSLTYAQKLKFLEIWSGLLAENKILPFSAAASGIDINVNRRLVEEKRNSEAQKVLQDGIKKQEGEREKHKKEQRKNEIKQILDEINSVSKNIHFYPGTQERIAEKISTWNLKEGKRALVTGHSGRDYLPIILARLGLKVSVIDIDKVSKAEQEELHREFGLDNSIASYLSYEDIPEEKFDYITVFGVLNVAVDIMETDVSEKLNWLKFMSGGTDEEKIIDKHAKQYFSPKIKDFIFPILEHLNLEDGLLLINVAVDEELSGKDYMLGYLEETLMQLQVKLGVQFKKQTGIDVSNISLHETYISEARQGIVYKAQRDDEITIIPETFIDTLKIRAYEAKKLNQDIIIGVDTSWIPESQMSYIQGLFSELTRLHRKEGLDNIIIKQKKGKRLANVLRKCAQERNVPNSNIIILGDQNILNEGVFNSFRKEPDPEKWALFAGLEIPNNFPEDNYIRLLEMITKAVELWSGKARPTDTPFLKIVQKGKRLFKFIIPEIQPETYERLKDLYRGQLKTVRSL